MKKINIVSLLVFVFIISAAAQTPIYYVYLAGDDNSGVYDRKYYIVWSKDEWMQIKEPYLIKNTRIQETITSIDFSKQALLLYFAGDQCNGVEVAYMKEEKDQINVRVNHLTFDPGCHNAALLVTPWLLISFKAKSGEKIILTEDMKQVHCD